MISADGIPPMMRKGRLRYKGDRMGNNSIFVWRNWQKCPYSVANRFFFRLFGRRRISRFRRGFRIFGKIYAAVIFAAFRTILTAPLVD
jgi:hypothetical protein